MQDTSVNYPESLSSFAGGVPAGVIFKIHLDDLRTLIEKSEETEGIPNAEAEVCLIGLVAYFEAFCRDHFASLINICPELVRQLKEKGRDVSVSAADLLEFDQCSPHRLGFLLAERYDFGTPKSINSLYQDLLLVTPFSKEEGARYGDLLRDRNLLVHYGGIYTTKYPTQRFTKRSIKGQIFFDSLIVNRATFLSAASFLEEIAQKTLNATYDKLATFIQENAIAQSKDQKKALEMLRSMIY